MDKLHIYKTFIEWKGNLGNGTKSYASYSRDYSIKSKNKHEILGSSDPSFRGNEDYWNPEELLVSALSACHKLWYLHLCSVNKVTVISYLDSAVGKMIEHATGKGEFIVVKLNPHIVIDENSDINKAKELHIEAHAFCFIARSVNFKIECNPTVEKQSH